LFPLASTLPTKFPNETSGLFGKPANSAEEDIELTRAVIMNHHTRLVDAQDDDIDIPPLAQAHDDEISTTDAAAANVAKTNSNKLDQTLSKLTNAFPLFVLAAAVLGTIYPSALLFVNRGSLISTLLASVMMGTGMTLTTDDFRSMFVGTERWRTVLPAGVACQYGIMPLAAWVVGRTLLLGRGVDATAQSLSLFLGLILVGCSPGGTASNLVSLIAGADVALSVALTAASTILAAGVTPLLVQLLIGSTVHISGMALCVATARVVLAPVLFGMLCKAKLPKIADSISRFAPFGSVIIVALICGGVVSNNASIMKSASAALSYYQVRSTFPT